MVNIESLLNESARKASLKLGKKIDEEGFEIFQKLRILEEIKELNKILKTKNETKKRKRL